MSSAVVSTAHRAYILQNRVSHARLLPETSKHAFTYPTLALFLSLAALETHALDLGNGWVFGYGRRWGITGLREQGYLHAEADNNDGAKLGFTEKLRRVLRERGHDAGRLGDVWMLTMPSYLGFEGINPLTVYYCYNPGGDFWLSVLEVHNTFGEAHVYILEAGKNEDLTTTLPPGYTHQWTLPREFHVSPFNDRAGFYCIALAVPPPPPSLSTNPQPAAPASDPPLPKVRIHFHNPPVPNSPPAEQEKESTSIGPLKITALLIPTHSTPLATPALLTALARYPGALLLSFPRILWQAKALHWKRGLDVYVRPEPRALLAGEEGKGGGGVRWQPPGALERYARARVCELVRLRARETGMRVVMRPNDVALEADVFEPAEAGKEVQAQTLEVRYLSPRVWTIIFASPSAVHARLLGASEGVFSTSNDALFDTLFSTPPSPLGTQRAERSLAQQIRAYPLPTSRAMPPVPTLHSFDSISSLDLSAPSVLSPMFAIIGTATRYAAETLELSPVEPLPSWLSLTSIRQWARYAADLAVLLVLLLLYYAEKWAFHALGARVVKGEEPWRAWERVVARIEGRATGDAGAQGVERSKDEPDGRGLLGSGCDIFHFICLIVDSTMKCVVRSKQRIIEHSGTQLNCAPAFVMKTGILQDADRQLSIVNAFFQLPVEKGKFSGAFSVGKQLFPGVCSSTRLDYSVSYFAY
ncbi:hypothetical protein HWV62_2460 [Athelia sp. TMB]|nr:hypothetical protein HWV62_2460 [Athelia sp. TMB]